MTRTNKIKMPYNKISEGSNPIWICYRCNLTFHESSAAYLHDMISNHPARKVEYLKKNQGGAKIVS